MPAFPTPQHALGLAVKARRQELGLTQEGLSLRSELHQRWISNVETGKRNPSYASLRRLAAGLDLPASELISKAEAIESSASAATPG
jgi:transcriptional regulator with XRE-family HTH domain